MNKNKKAWQPKIAAGVAMTLALTGAIPAVSTQAATSVPATSVKISNPVSVLVVGDSYDINRTLKPSNSTDKTTFTSSNPSIAEPDAYGRFTVKKTGLVTITARTTSGKKDKCSILVVSKYGVTSLQSRVNRMLAADNIKKMYIRDLKKKKSYTIPEGDYKDKKLWVRAPYSEVDNYGTFSFIKMYDIKNGTWKEHAKGNSFNFADANGAFQIMEGGQVDRLNLTAKKGAVRVILEGIVNTLRVMGDESKVNVKTDGTSKVMNVSGKQAEVVLEATKGTKGKVETLNITGEKSKTTVGENATVTTANVSKEAEVAVEGNMTTLKVSADNTQKVTLSTGEKAKLEKIQVTGDATINLTANSGIKEIVLENKADVTITGNTEKLAIRATEKAEGAKIKSSVPVEVSVGSKVEITLNKGAEGSKIEKTNSQVNVSVKNDTEEKVTIGTAGSSQTESLSPGGSTSGGGSTGGGGSYLPTPPEKATVTVKNVKAVDDKTITFTSETSPVAISISPVITMASISVDGSNQYTVKFTDSLKEGTSYKLTVKKDGYKDGSGTFTYTKPEEPLSGLEAAKAKLAVYTTSPLTCTSGSSVNLVTELGKIVSDAGITITITSSSNSAIAADGAITYPADAAVTGEVAVNLSDGTKTESVTIMVKVEAAVDPEVTAKAAVDAAATAIKAKEVMLSINGSKIVVDAVKDVINNANVTVTLKTVSHAAVNASGEAIRFDSDVTGTAVVTLGYTGAEYTTDAAIEVKVVKDISADVLAKVNNASTSAAMVQELTADNLTQLGVSVKISTLYTGLGSNSKYQTQVADELIAEKKSGFTVDTFKVAFEKAVVRANLQKTVDSDLDKATTSGAIKVMKDNTGKSATIIIDNLNSTYVVSTTNGSITISGNAIASLPASETAIKVDVTLTKTEQVSGESITATASKSGITITIPAKDAEKTAIQKAKDELEKYTSQNPFTVKTVSGSSANLITDYLNGIVSKAGITGITITASSNSAIAKDGKITASTLAITGAVTLELKDSASATGTAIIYVTVDGTGGTIDPDTPMTDQQLVKAVADKIKSLEVTTGESVTIVIPTGAAISGCSVEINISDSTIPSGVVIATNGTITSQPDIATEASIVLKVTSGAAAATTSPIKVVIPPKKISIATADAISFTTPAGITVGTGDAVELKLNNHAYAADFGLNITTNSGIKVTGTVSPNALTGSALTGGEAAFPVIVEIPNTTEGAITHIKIGATEYELKGNSNKAIYATGDSIYVTYPIEFATYASDTWSAITNSAVEAPVIQLIQKYSKEGVSNSYVLAELKYTFDLSKIEIK